MNYLSKLKFHYKTKNGWVNDPNGLVFYKGYYHIFYQHCPDLEIPNQQPMHWGHARTKDFLEWEELPVALYPDKSYDSKGCWSGTAIVKDDILYLFYASIEGDEYKQTVSMAYSKDGINFEKYENNPIIGSYPADGSHDFRDPAVAYIDDTYYIVMASGHEATKTGRLLLYKSKNLTDWQYSGVMAEWEDCRFTECPSFVKEGEKFVLSASVCPNDKPHYFQIMYGDFFEGVFTSEINAENDKGPDQYAGQIFTDDKGRNILISWIPGWNYRGFAEKDIGCMSLPREIIIKDGKIKLYPVEEIQHILKDSDPAVKITNTGFMVERSGRTPVIYEGKIDDLKILRDEYVLEIFVNGGEAVYTIIL